MRHFLSTIIILAMAFSSSWCARITRSHRDIKNFDELNDLALDEREATEEELNYLLHRNFDSDDYKKNDDDLYFSQGNDNAIKRRKSTSYSDWLKKKEFTLNDAENQEEEEKGFLKKFVASVKNMLHKLGKRN
ncbi:PREDICTED: uncharacterized protein LOC107341975 [Acropora digitifera]|uniref:uncharacterized protein LOC107341975 n=1 Tax=Acropora digitifera TaxID=70779 RepID=UPI00077A5CC9|nr:PREDICTED: uncharacterized protein LOC107341975 [Acropora digitifera]